MAWIYLIMAGTMQWSWSVGAFILGILLFIEAATLARFSSVGLIVSRIVGLKLASSH
jgi:multidrug transporter EmrE-like cation transporter